MPAFADLLFHVKHAFTPRTISRTLCYYGMTTPANLSDMLLSGEQPDYIVAAILAVNSQGE